MYLLNNWPPPLLLLIFPSFSYTSQIMRSCLPTKCRTSATGPNPLSLGYKISSGYYAAGCCQKCVTAISTGSAGYTCTYRPATGSANWRTCLALCFASFRNSASRASGCAFASSRLQASKRRSYSRDFSCHVSPPIGFLFTSSRCRRNGGAILSAQTLRKY